MNRIGIIVIACLALVYFSAECQAADSTEPIQTIQLPKVTSHFDHFGVDPDGGRLFATLQTENLVHVYQLQSGDELGTISGIGKPHAVLFRKDLDRLFRLPSASSTNFIVVRSIEDRNPSRRRLAAVLLAQQRFWGWLVSS